MLDQDRFKFVILKTFHLKMMKLEPCLKTISLQIINKAELLKLTWDNLKSKNQKMITCSLLILTKIKSDHQHWLENSGTKSSIYVNFGISVNLVKFTTKSSFITKAKTIMLSFTNYQWTSDSCYISLMRHLKWQLMKMIISNILHLQTSKTLMYSTNAWKNYGFSTLEIVEKVWEQTLEEGKES